MNPLNYRYLFLMDETQPQNSLKICVKRCPREKLENVAEIYSFYTRTGSNLCRYDFNFTKRNDGIPAEYSSQFNRNDQSMAKYSSTSGPCPAGVVHPTSVSYHGL